MATKLETRIIFSGAVRHLSQLRRNIRTNAERDLARVSRGDANAVSTHQADLANSRDVLARIVQVMQQQRVALDAFASRAEVDELIADAQEIQTELDGQSTANARTPAQVQAVATATLQNLPEHETLFDGDWRAKLPR